jgi:6-phosphogluconolactonase
MAREALLDHVPIPRPQIHRVPTELPPVQAAASYERELAAHFGSGGSDPPRFDVLLLGIGTDGHTASLFPEDPVLDEARRWVREVRAPAASPPDRITFTLPVLDAARMVLFLCAGPAKAPIVKAILGSPPAADARWPAARVRAPALWYVDRLAHPPPESESRS